MSTRSYTRPMSSQAETDTADRSTVDAPMTHADIRAMIDTIETMREADQYQVFEIFRQDTSKYTENRNGVFVNLSHVDESTLQKLATYVQYWNLQQTAIAKTEAESRALAQQFCIDTDATPGALPKPPVTTVHDTVKSDAQREQASTAVDAELTDSERELVKVHLEHRRISLHKGKKHRFEGSAARVARKCLHSDDGTA
jgi:hypothetical protein